MGPTSNYNTNKKLEKAHAKKEKMISIKLIDSSVDDIFQHPN